VEEPAFRPAARATLCVGLLALAWSGRGQKPGLREAPIRWPKGQRFHRCFAPTLFMNNPG
jgi:hypothetical protein